MTDAPEAAPLLPLWRVSRISYDEKGLLVVDKQAGIPTYGGEEGTGHSLVERLKAYLRGKGREDYLAVHQRLDQETSGVMFFVTDPALNEHLGAAMEQHQITRVYRAVVGSAVSGRSLTLPEAQRVEVWLRHERGRSLVSSERPHSSKEQDAQRAVTHMRVLERAGERALLELRLETGRTHQIRATLAHLGYPVVGDRLYRGARASRLMLHAHEISGSALPATFRAEMPFSFIGALRGEETFPKDAREALFDAACLRAPILQMSDAVRLVNGAGDGLLGLTVDAYGPYAVLGVYDESLQERIQEVGRSVLELGYAGVYLKRRVRADLRKEEASALSPGGPLLGGAAPDSFVVTEHGVKLRVWLDDGLSTGLFLDMRENRRRVRELARGARMLNLFCYTSSFSVAAAMGGATTTSIDISAKALERSRLNFGENSLDLAGHRFIKEDAMKYLARAVRRGEQYDFIVLDPPSFSTVGKGTFSVKNQYSVAARDCFQLLSPGGKLLCVTNHTETSPRDFRELVQTAAKEARRDLVRIKDLKPSLDFPPHPRGPWPSKSLLAEVR